jgi:ribosome recycling factor
MIDDVIRDAKARMDKSATSFRAELTKMRTGRAHPSLLDHVRVDYYGVETPITQAATVNVEDPRTLTVTAWDKAMVTKIERAILESNLGLNPRTAGTVMHIPMPPLNEERRRELIKVVRAEAEQARVAIRNVRRDANHTLKELVKEKEISEDDERRGEQEIQKLTDAQIKNIDAMLAEKEAEMLEV